MGLGHLHDPVDEINLSAEIIEQATLGEPGFFVKAVERAKSAMDDEVRRVASLIQEAVSDELERRLIESLGGFSKVMPSGSVTFTSKMLENAMRVENGPLVYFERPFPNLIPTAELPLDPPMTDEEAAAIVERQERRRLVDVDGVPDSRSWCSVCDRPLGNTPLGVRAYYVAGGILCDDCDENLAEKASSYGHRRGTKKWRERYQAEYERACVFIDDQEMKHERERWQSDDLSD